MRGELFTTKVILENRSYFFNVKENRTGDVFLQIVESKSRSGEDFERRDIVVFADDMQQFFRGMDESLSFIDQDRRERKKSRRPFPAKSGPESGAGGEKFYSRVARPPEQDRQEKPAPPKRTGRIHIVSKKTG